jgi:hypothetical protein
MSRNLTVDRMQECVNRLGISLEVAWLPNSEKDKQGEIVLASKTLFIYSPSESEAWQTFIHELLEYKIKDVTQGYRLIINSLIEVVEKMTYERKERFLEFVPFLVQEVMKFEQTK